MPILIPALLLGEGGNLASPGLSPTHKRIPALSERRDQGVAESEDLACPPPPLPAILFRYVYAR
jgi:hypothetical protein